MSKEKEKICVGCGGTFTTTKPDTVKCFGCIIGNIPPLEGSDVYDWEILEGVVRNYGVKIPRKYITAYKNYYETVIERTARRQGVGGRAHVEFSHKEKAMI